MPQSWHPLLPPPFSFPQKPQTCPLRPAIRPSTSMPAPPLHSLHRLCVRARARARVAPTAFPNVGARALRTRLSVSLPSFRFPTNPLWHKPTAATTQSPPPPHTADVAQAILAFEQSLSPPFPLYQTPPPTPDCPLPLPLPLYLRPPRHPSIGHQSYLQQPLPTVWQQAPQPQPQRPWRPPPPLQSV